MSREARVGIFVLLGLVVLTYFTFRVSKWGGIGERGYLLTADFRTVAGLEPKADVKMAGVPIGKVEAIELAGDKARVVLRVREEVRIPADSTAAIQSQGLLGEKYIEIIPGKDAKALPPGGRFASTMTPTDLDEVVRKVSAISDDIKKFTESLSGAFGGEEGKKALSDILRNVRETTDVLRTVVKGNEDRLNRILANVDSLSADLREISAANKEDLRATVANLRSFSETLKKETPGLAKKLEEMSERLSGVVGENRENLKASIENLRSASAKLDNTLESASRVMGRIERGEGTIGKLVSDNTTAETVTQTLEGIGRYVRRAEALKTYIDYRLEYQTSPGEYKNYANLRIQPSADKFYQLGVVDDPRGKLSSTTTTTTTTPPGTTVVTQTDTYSNKIKFSALVAKRFSGFTIRGGVLESTGGLGIDYEAWRRLKLGAEAFDFNRKDQPPHLKLYGDYDIVKNLYVTGGVDDVLNSDQDFRTFFLGFGIKFADDDLKTVLGTVPIKP